MQAEDHGAQRHRHMKGQADDADDVVRIQPQAFQIGAPAQREEILDPGGPQHDHTRHQSKRVEAADDGHHQDAGLQVGRKAGGAMQLIHELPDAALPDRVHLQSAVGFLARRKRRAGAGRLACSPRFLPVQSGGAARVRGQLHHERAGGGRVRGHHLVNQCGQLRQRRLQAGLGSRPARNRFLEHGDRAGIKGHEQRQPAQQAGPGVHLLVRFDQTGARGCA
ncbi:hypothetical protein G6F59_014998 [Rhizopus arrhizus]|nr:hypothetical protein G6F59_014998 [Rhizopus arrhizus]